MVIPRRLLSICSCFAVLLAFTIPTASGQALPPTEDVEVRVPYVPTPQEVVTAMLKLADVKKSDTVYDLGCGDGRIVVTAAKEYGARGVGIDINPERIHEARANADQAGVNGQTRFLVNDLLKTDFHEATVVTLYLLPDVNMRLRPKLQKELKAGTRIVSHQFDMGDWKPDKEVTVNGRRIYLWTVSAKSKAD